MERFEDLFEDCTNMGRKIKTSEYLESGQYAIVDQGQKDIAGYTDETDGVYEDVPALVFGDHTRIIKYIDIPFFLGADGVKLLKCKREDANYRYLYYALKNVKIPDTGYNRHFKWLKEIKIMYPDAIQQQRIVDVLDRIENIIESRRHQVEELDILIKSRFVEMFGDPATNPMKWLETRVGTECYYIKDGPHKSLPDIGRENGGHPFISVRNIVNHMIDFSTAKYISDEDYSEARKKCFPEKGDILYSKGGTTGIAKLIDVDVEFANWVHLAVLKFDREVLNGVFFENMLNCDYCYAQSQKLTKGVANRDLVLSAMAQIKMFRPPINLQEQFAIFVEQVDKSKFAVQRSLEKMEILKESLMQKYFG